MVTKYASFLLLSADFVASPNSTSFKTVFNTFPTRSSIFSQQGVDFKASQSILIHSMNRNTLTTQKICQSQKKKRPNTRSVSGIAFVLVLVVELYVAYHQTGDREHGTPNGRYPTKLVQRSDISTITGLI